PGFHGGVPRPLYVSGHPQLGYYVARYDEEIAAVVGGIGRVLAALAASPVAAHTLVVFTSDDGDSLDAHDYHFHHGVGLYDPGLHVRLLVALAGACPARRQVLASTRDVMPTILAAARLRADGVAGEDLGPVLAGGEGPKRRSLFGRNDHDQAAVFDAR